MKKLVMVAVIIAATMAAGSAHALTKTADANITVTVVLAKISIALGTNEETWKIGDPDPFALGDTAHHTATVTNNSNVAVDLTLKTNTNILWDAPGVNPDWVLVLTGDPLANDTFRMELDGTPQTPFDSTATIPLATGVAKSGGTKAFALSLVTPNATTDANNTNGGCTVTVTASKAA